MHSKLLALDPATALNHGWTPLTTLAALANETLCEISGRETVVALHHLPLAFSPNAAGEYQLVALLGLCENENLLLAQDGRWLSGFMPTRYRAYPFIAQYSDTEMTVLFDTASGLYTETPDSESRAGRFFTPEGEPSPLLQQIIEVLGKQGVALQQTASAVAALQQANLLEPWPLFEPVPEQQLLPVQNLYRINQQALENLSADALVELHPSGALALAYAQLYSMPRVQTLKALLKAKRTPNHQPAPANSGVPSVDSIDPLFGRKDDTLKFNF